MCVKCGNTVEFIVDSIMAQHNVCCNCTKKNCVDCSCFDEFYDFVDEYALAQCILSDIYLENSDLVDTANDRFMFVANNGEVCTTNFQGNMQIIHERFSYCPECGRELG